MAERELPSNSAFRSSRRRDRTSLHTIPTQLESFTGIPTQIQHDLFDTVAPIVIYRGINNIATPLSIIESISPATYAYVRRNGGTSDEQIEEMLTLVTPVVNVFWEEQATEQTPPYLRKTFALVDELKGDTENNTLSDLHEMIRDTLLGNEKATKRKDRKTVNKTFNKLPHEWNNEPNDKETEPKPLGTDINDDRPVNFNDQQPAEAVYPPVFPTESTAIVRDSVDVFPAMRLEGIQSDITEQEEITTIFPPHKEPADLASEPYVITIYGNGEIITINGGLVISDLSDKSKYVFLTLAHNREQGLTTHQLDTTARQAGINRNGQPGGIAWSNLKKELSNWKGLLKRSGSKRYSQYQIDAVVTFVTDIPDSLSPALPPTKESNPPIPQSLPVRYNEEPSENRKLTNIGKLIAFLTENPDATLSEQCLHIYGKDLKKPSERKKFIILRSVVKKSHHELIKKARGKSENKKKERSKPVAQLSLEDRLYKFLLEHPNASDDAMFAHTFTRDRTRGEPLWILYDLLRRLKSKHPDLA